MGRPRVHRCARPHHRATGSLSRVPALGRPRGSRCLLRSRCRPSRACGALRIPSAGTWMPPGPPGMMGGLSEKLHGKNNGYRAARPVFPDRRRALPQGSRPVPEALTRRPPGVGRIGLGRSHLVLVWARGGLPCPRRTRPPRHLRCRGNGAHDLHHRGQLLPDRRGVSQRRRRIPRCKQAPFPDTRNGIRLRAPGRLRAHDFSLDCQRHRRAVQLLSRELAALQAGGRLRGAVPPDPAEHARRAGIRDNADADLPRFPSHARRRRPLPDHRPPARVSRAGGADRR